MTPSRSSKILSKYNFRPNSRVLFCANPDETIDAELTARAAILRIDLTQNQLSQALDILEDKGPFTQTFIQDSARVYDILHTVWGTSQTWTHARAVAGKTKNGRKAYRTLHAQLLGGQPS